MATIDEAKLVTPERLRTVFNHIDTDGSGSLSADEIKAILCFDDDFDPYEVDKIIKQADTNNDGEI